MIERYLPRFIKKKLIKAARRIIIEINKKQSETIPKFEIQASSLNSAKLLPNREVLLDFLPKGGAVAELGVDRGEFSKKILELNQPQTLHLVDLWGTVRYHQGKRKEVEERFSKEILDGRVRIHHGYSTNLVDDFEDEYFDWIYIDTDHSYLTTQKELELWSKKIKSGGIIAGHDYILGNWNGLVRYGVIEAVHEFCNNQGWEILYLTMELSISPSFAIKKIRK